MTTFPVHHRGGAEKKKKKLKWEAGHLVKSLAVSFTGIETALGSLQNAQNQNIKKATIIGLLPWV